jgi:AraC-like DNA-binding protein
VTKRRSAEISPEWHGWWRASERPGLPLALGARSVGRCAAPRGWHHGTGTVGWTNLYWGVSGAVDLMADGQRVTISANELWLHPPASRISGTPSRNAGSYRWLTIDGEHAAATIAACGLGYHFAHSAGPCPVALFDRLESEVQAFGPHAEARASATVYAILTAAIGGSLQRHSELVAQARAMITERFTDPDFSIQALATTLGLDRSVLSRRFSAECQRAPAEFLQELRLQHARSLLAAGQLPIASIAQRCGFTDPAYFARRIRHTFGASPRSLRGLP